MRIKKENKKLGYHFGSLFCFLLTKIEICDIIKINRKEINFMNIKERINTIKAKKAQIEALLSAKEKEVEEEYQIVMERYNEVSKRVEAIKAKQKAIANKN